MTETLTLSHVFGSTKRKGSWRVPANVVLRQRMGSTELDFTEAELADAHTVIDVDMVGGSIELRVPSDVRVTSELSTTLASFEDHRKTDSAAATRSITLRGRAIWGSVADAGVKSPGSHPAAEVLAGAVGSIGTMLLVAGTI